MSSIFPLNFPDNLHNTHILTLKLIRSPNKPTWPNLMDNFVGGAVSEGLTVLDTAVKEAKEEAGVPLELAQHLQPAGLVSFFHSTSRGVHPNTEFVFDLDLPEDFVPLNTDGEVESWRLVPASELVGLICRPEEFKITSSPVVVDWLVRRGDTLPRLIVR